MKITFIRPNMTATRAGDAMQPLAFAVLAAHTPPHIEPALYDERIEPVDTQHPTDLVAMTVETYTARRAYEISAEFRRRGVPVVMGGYHPTFLPDEALEHADAVVIGDAEELWPQVVADAETGTLQRIYRQQQQPMLTAERTIAHREVNRSHDRHTLTWFGKDTTHSPVWALPGNAARRCDYPRCACGRNYRAGRCECRRAE